MNIFVLDLNHTLCAQSHNDRHVSKMILESAQLLCTCLRSCGIEYGYKLFNPNHPCNKWVRHSYSNFIWLRSLALELGREFTHRYGTTHKSIEVITQAPNPTISDLGLTPFAQALPEQYRHTDAVQAYRAYYRGDKYDLLTYTNRQPPEWLCVRFKVSSNGSVVYQATERTERNVYDWSV